MLRCQGYGHVAANCLSPVKVAKVTKPPVTNSESLPPLLLTPTVIVCFGHLLLPPLLPITSTFPLCHMLGPKSKFSTDLIPIFDQFK